ncbi:MAG: hypothetical protein QXG17_03950 [Sulfolobales archaeon]
MVGNLGRVSLIAITTCVTYIVLTIVITLLLSFPGYGVVLLPQPFLRVLVLGKTISYEFAGVHSIIWVLYVVVAHFILYHLVMKLTRFLKPYIIVSVAIYLLNLALILGGLSDENLVRLVRTYTIGYAGALPGTGITVIIEWLGYRVGHRIRRKLPSTT